MTLNKHFTEYIAFIVGCAVLASAKFFLPGYLPGVAAPGLEKLRSLTLGATSPCMWQP